MSKRKFNFNATLHDLQEKLLNAIDKFYKDTESSFEWLRGVVPEARSALGVSDIQVPKTPAKKRGRATRQTRNNGLAPIQEGALGSVEDLQPAKKLRSNSILDCSVKDEHPGNSRPKRKASSAAEAKIKQTYHFISATKLRRPSVEGDISMLNAVDVYYTSSVATAEAAAIIDVPESRQSSTAGRKKLKKKTPGSSSSVQSAVDEGQQQTVRAKGKPGRKPRKLAYQNTDDTDHADEPDAARDVVVEEPAPSNKTKSRKLPQSKTAETKTEVIGDRTENRHVEEQSKGTCTEVSITDTIGTETTEVEVVPLEKKPRTRRAKAAAAEPPPKPTRVTRSKKAQMLNDPAVGSEIARNTADTTTAPSRNIHINEQLATKSPCVEGSPCKRALRGELATTSQKSPLARAFSPLRKKFAAIVSKPLFSPFKKTPMKNKVEAFEAKLRGETLNISEEDELEERPELPQVCMTRPSVPDVESETVLVTSTLANATFVKESSPPAARDEVDHRDDENAESKQSESTRTSKEILQSQYRKSLQKARKISQAKVASTRTSTELDQATDQKQDIEEEKQSSETSDENSEETPAPAVAVIAQSQSPVAFVPMHVSTLTKSVSSPAINNKVRLMTTYSASNLSNFSGSSSGSSQSRIQSLLKNKAGPSNLVTGLSTFVAKNIVQGPQKSSDEDEAQRKELELKRLKEKEEEAARKREELLKAKAEEQKQKLEERAKKAMERRQARAREMEEQTKARQLTEEKTVVKQRELKAKLQEENEKRRIALANKLLEAEERRKADELKLRQLREQEEAQKKAVAKKEQEEQEKLAKIKQAEAEKLAKEKTKLNVQPKTAAPAAAAAASSAANTTITLVPKAVAEIKNPDTYQITPVRMKKTTGKVNPDNYDIGDLASDDSTDDDTAPKKHIPSWAKSLELRTSLKAQLCNPIPIEEIFPVGLLAPPDLNLIFPQKRARFNKRTSSAVWNTPPARVPF